MTRDPKKYLTDMLDSSRFLIEITANKTIRDYREDRMFRSAVERELQIVGEALYQLYNSDPNTAKRISDHERIIRFRHQLVHGYHDLNPELVWSIVETRLEGLVAEVESLIASL